MDLDQREVLPYISVYVDSVVVITLIQRDLGSNPSPEIIIIINENAKFLLQI